MRFLELLLQVHISNDLASLRNLLEKFIKPSEASDDGALKDIVSLLTNVLELGTLAPSVDDLHQVRIELLHILLSFKRNL